MKTGAETNWIYGRGGVQSVCLVVTLALTSLTQAEVQPELQEVVVTATRVAQDINKVPVSITALTGEQLEDQHILRMDDLTLVTPGVQFHHTGTGGSAQTTEISIRGIQSNIGDGTTGIYINDTPVQVRKAGLSFSATNGYPELFDLERVEVLRGPQGTLFGSGSMGGAVRFITPEPDLSKSNFYTRGEVGFTAHGDPNLLVGFAAGVPIIADELAVRFSAQYRRDGGYMDRESHWDLAADQQRQSEGTTAVTLGPRDKNYNWDEAKSVRLALTWAPSEGLKITPSIQWQDVYANAQGAYWDYYSHPSGGQFVSGDGVDSPYDDRWTLASLNVSYSFSGMSLISTTSYFDRYSTTAYDCTTCMIQLTALGPQNLTPTQFLPNYPTFAEQTHDVNQQLNWTEEIRLQSDNSNGRLTWVLGAFFSNEKSVSQDFVPVDAATFTQLSQSLGALQNPPVFFPSYSDLFYGASLIDNQISYETLDSVREKQAAAFGDVSWEVVSGLKLTGGLRYTHYHLDATSLQGGPYAGTSELDGFSAAQTESATTPKGAITWQFTDNDMVYVSASKGFRGGGVNQPLPVECDPALASVGLSAPPDTYKSDNLWSYELGTKDRLFNNRVNISASVFYVKWKDIQQSVYLSLGCNRSAVLNANSATSEGFDLQGMIAATESLTLDGSVSYTKATYDEPLEGSPDPTTGERPIIINAGNSLDGVVPWNAALGMTYSSQIKGYKSKARLDWQYSSAQKEPGPTQDPATTTYLPHSREIPSINQVNARYAVTLGNAEVSLFLTNIFDAHPSIQSYAGDQFNSVTQSYTIRPRTAGVGFSYRY